MPKNKTTAVNVHGIGSDPRLSGEIHVIYREGIVGGDGLVREPGLECYWSYRYRSSRPCH